jgi:hypothetical protein
MIEVFCFDIIFLFVKSYSSGFCEHNYEILL